MQIVTAGKPGKSKSAEIGKLKSVLWRPPNSFVPKASS